MRLALAAILLTSTSTPALAGPPTIRINVGGPAVSTQSGAFLADQPYAGSGYGYVGGSPLGYKWPLGFYDDPEAAVASSAREGFNAYRVDVPAGRYLIHLHFAELSMAVHGPNLRVFDLSLEGTPVLSSYDVAAEFGFLYHGRRSFVVNVIDGRLDLQVGAGGGKALLNGIEIIPVGEPTPAPAAPQLAVEAGAGQNVLRWNALLDPLVTDYRVEAAPAPDGPFTLLAVVPGRPPRYHDTSAPTQSPRSYRVTARNAHGQFGGASPTQTQTALTADQLGLPEYELVISPEDLAFLDSHVLSEPSTEVPATFRYQGVTYAVEVRYRGAQSRRFSKKSWKVKFPSQTPFLGRRELNLKAHFADFSQTREPMAIDLFHLARHPAATRAPVLLRVNGTSRGLFDQIEQIDELYLKARDRDPGASIYKCESNFSVLPTTADYEAVYEKKTNTGTDHSDVIQLIDLLNNTPDAEFARELVAVFDVDRYLDYLAVIGWLADGDSVLHNYYLIHDHALERFELVTWDNELSFGLVPFGLIPNAQVAVDFGTDGSVDGPGTMFGSNVLKTRVLDVPAFRYRYGEKLNALMATHAAPAAMAGRIDAFHAVVAASAHGDPTKWGYEWPDLFESGPATLKSFATARHAYLTAALPAYVPATPNTAVWIEEIMPSNASTLLDEALEAEDWIELHNPGALPVNVAGMYLTDDPSQPTQWAIPDGTVIAAGGYLVIFADDEPSDGPLHATFKLDKDGEAVALFDRDGKTLLDFVHYAPPQPTDVSYGRLPPHRAFFALLPTPTPGAPNDASGNLAPLITWLDVVPALPAPGQSVAVECQVTDADGVALVDISYRANGGATHTLPMSPLGADRFGADLPPQPAGTIVEFYVRATDSMSAASLEPPSAPAEWLSYTVTPPAAGALRITEVVADNEGGVLDEAGDYEDWLEIWNGDLVARDLTGMYLTDDHTNPTKWPIPAGTILPPGGRLVVFADEEPAEGPFHAGFKLSKNGEDVGLFDGASTNTWLDAWSYPAVEADVAYGRLPDAGDERFYLFHPTPGASNTPAPGTTAGFGAAGASPIALSATAPQTGAVMTVTMQAAGSTGAFVLGLTVAKLPIPGEGTLLTEPLAVVPVSLNGGATLPLFLPNDASLQGATLVMQGWVAGLGLSSGIIATPSR